MACGQASPLRVHALLLTRHLSHTIYPPQSENLALARTSRKENFYPITWELLYDLDNGMASHAKAMACDKFGYDCDVVVDEAAAVGALRRFKAFTIGICTRVKNEGPYLSEWINLHYVAGVAKFYMWYDESDDDTYQILKNYERMGIVRLYNITILPGHAPGSQPFPHAEHRCDQILALTRSESL
jgi:hypothetical protein